MLEHVLKVGLEGRLKNRMFGVVHTQDLPRRDVFLCLELDVLVFLLERLHLLLGDLVALENVTRRAHRNSRELFACLTDKALTVAVDSRLSF